MLSRLKLVFLALPFCILTFSIASSPILIDSKKQLFLDDYLIASMKGVHRTVQKAHKFPGNPVIWPTEKWEPAMATIYGSVLRDAGKFNIWYKSGTGVAYAESADGITWNKPLLNLVLEDGEPTNILFRKTNKTESPPDFPFCYELFGVHRDDRESDPSRRYKMGFLDIDWKYTGKDGDPWHKGQRRGLGVAGSPDGIHWKLIENWASEAIVDGATHWMFDPVRQKYVLYGRTRKALPEVEKAWSTNAWFKNWFSARAVARIESSDFLHWDYQKPDTAPAVLTADLQDKPGTEIYSMKVFPYAGIYIGLVQVFHATPDDSTLDIELAVSRDTIHFSRIRPLARIGGEGQGEGATFLDLGGIGTWDRFNLSLANNDPIPVGDDLRIYYGGRMYRHGLYSGPDKGPERGGIGFATIQRDRFVALEASFHGGEILTKPLILKSPNLRLNVNSKFGQVLIEVIDLQNQHIVQSKLITADALNFPVQWEGAIPPAPQPVTIRIQLKNAQLFALWCE